MRYNLRPAAITDADSIAAIFSPSLRLLTFLPRLYTVEQERWFIENVIFRECEVTLAEDDSGIVALLARQREEIRLLYVRPDRVGLGAGTRLIEAAKMSGATALELWCFQ